MEVGVMKSRPPHIRFVMQPVEDRNKSIEAGHPVFADVAHVVITPQGSKDSVTKPVKEWLENTDQQVREERLPAEWAEKFHAGYAHWKRGEEIPVEGIALANWPAISPAELLTCKGIHIMTVEDLATANEEGLRRLGMGGLELKKRAKQYLDASAGPGKLMAENKALSQRLEETVARNTELEQRMIALEAKFGGESQVKTVVHEDTIERKL